MGLFWGLDKRDREVFGEFISAFRSELVWLLNIGNSALFGADENLMTNRRYTAQGERGSGWW